MNANRIFGFIRLFLVQSPSRCIGLKSNVGWIKISFYIKAYRNQILTAQVVYKFKTIMDDQFRKVIIRCKRSGYNLNVKRQSACLMINPITVDDFAAPFNCRPVDRSSDSMMTPILSYSF